MCILARTTTQPGAMRIDAVEADRLHIRRDGSGGSAFGILWQSIIERQPCLLAGNPDVFSGLEIFWLIQAAARQSDHTGARPLGEQRRPADCAEAANKNRGRIAASQRTGHSNSIQGHEHPGIESRAKRPLTDSTVADAHIDRLALCHISRSATEAPAFDNLQLALPAAVRARISQPMVCRPPNLKAAYVKNFAPNNFSHRHGGAGQGRLIDKILASLDCSSQFP